MLNVLIFIFTSCLVMDIIPLIRVNTVKLEICVYHFNTTSRITKYKQIEEMRGIQFART